VFERDDGKATAITPYLRTWSRLALLMLAIQIFLGGWTSTNYVALYCPDFPTCQGQWWPQTDFPEAFTFIKEIGVNYEGGTLTNEAGVTVHLMHRIGALLSLFIVGGLAVVLMKNRDRTLRTISYFILTLLCVQISLGIANVLLLLPIQLAVSHNAFAALLLLSLVTLNYATSRTTVCAKEATLANDTITDNTATDGSIINSNEKPETA
jgi:cytochrome c oxidase assembly protein subunit 15